MKLFRSLIYLFSVVIPLTISAQSKIQSVCGSDAYFNELCKKDPSLLVKQQEAENLMLIQNASPMQAQQATTKIIPVVFHIIHQNGSENIPDSYLKDQIKRLNEDYRKANADITNVRSQFASLATDMGIEFRIARIDPSGNCTNGITRYYSTLTVDATDNVKSLPGQYWDSKKYLNVWVVNSIYNNTGNPNQRVLGYSYFPMTSAGSSVDGVLIRSDAVGYDYRTLTHEVGHYLGLFHTFQDGCPNSNCTSTGDKVCDTPPAAAANFGCDKTTNSCSTETPDQLDMIENYMDYTDCTYMFTAGQSNRVQYYFYLRTTLVSTSNLQATGVYDTTNYTCKVVANFAADPTSICVGQPITFSSTSFANPSAQYIWEFAGGNPPVSFDKNPSITYSASGKYDVKLVVKNTVGKDSIIKQQAVVIFPQNGFTIPVKETFESATLSNDLWVIDPMISSIGWARNNKAAYTGNYSFYVNNFQCTQKDLVMSFIMPPVNLSGKTAPVLTFKHAFASQSSTHTDKLVVYGSDDCGVTWYPRYTRTPFNLPTTQTYYTTEFVPNSSSLWAYDQVDLTFFQNKPNVLLKFVFTTGLGNNLYIDDINVGLATDIEKTITANDFMIYPNPANKSVNIRFPEIQPGLYKIALCDLLGNILFTSNVESSFNNSTSINLQDAGITKSGTYIIKIVSKDKTFTKLFSVTE